MTADLAAAIEEYADGPRRLRQAVEAIAPDRLGVRPAPGRWSAREIALHLCDTEVSVVFRMKRAIAEPGGPVLAFDQERWTDALAPLQDLPAALAAFAALRAEMAAVLARLPADAWERTCLHPELGSLPLREWLHRTLRHTRNHIAQLAPASGAGPG